MDILKSSLNTPDQVVDKKNHNESNHLYISDIFYATILYSVYCILAEKKQSFSWVLWFSLDPRYYFPTFLSAVGRT